MKITHTELATFVPCLSHSGIKKLLHVGCGTSPKNRLPECFQTEQWHEVRLDIDPKVKPDIVASLTDMAAVSSTSADAVWSSHSLEHLEGFQVKKALKEFYRVLKPGGFVLITLPDLTSIAALIIEERAAEALYQSPAGPITPLDMLFGHQASIEKGHKYMAHRTGFTQNLLRSKLIEAGFHEVRVMKGRFYDLWAIGIKKV